MRPALPLPTRLCRIARAVATLAACAALPGAALAQAPSSEAAPDCTFVNPVAPGQDPWVVRHGDAYYMVESRDRGIYVYRSPTLTDPKRNEVRVWLAPESGWNRDHLWAPELHFIDGRWYVYYAGGAAGPPFVHQRSGVLESESEDPQGPYRDRGMLRTGDGVTPDAEPIWAIDVTVARLDGRLYAVWSGWEASADTDKTPQHLYIAPMANPWTLSARRVRISSPVEDWERGTELDLNEGPTFLVRGDRVFILYSARESWLPAYRMGQLALVEGGDPLEPASWVKSGPVFTGTEDVHGVGHASFTVSPDGSEDWIVYHSKTSTEPGWQRVVRIQPFRWSAEGSPLLGTPVSPGEPIPVPSGQCPTGP